MKAPQATHPKSSLADDTRIPLISCQQVRRIYGQGQGSNVALEGVDLEIDSGAAVAIVGPSGSGKSTLLHLIGAMDRADDGRVVVGGRDLGELDDAAASRFRREEIGFVFQFFNLVPTLSALDNVALPARLAGVGAASARARARELLGSVGLGNRGDESPDALSGGQQQRVAIARALINDPTIVLADEPTGALDTHAGAEVLDLMRSLVRQRGLTLVVVTHSEAALDYVERVVRLEDGRIVRNTTREGAPS